MTIAAAHAHWITLPQAVVCNAIERVARVRFAARGEQDSLLLWIGQQRFHRTSWFDISPAGEITSVTRGDGKRTMSDVALADVASEFKRLHVWAYYAEPDAEQAP